MNADAIIERLEKLETWWADLGDDQDVLVVRKSDLDAAIADIRGYLQEPVTVWMGVEESEDEDYVNALCELFASEAAANAWRLEAPGNRSSVEMRVRQRLIPDAQGGNDAG